jgi:hypothetical protein
MMASEAEREFGEDIRSKKQTGHGARHKRGKGAAHRTSVKLPSDFLTGRAIKKLSGKVRVYNMYDTIISKEEFSKADKETQKTMMERWRGRYQAKEILKKMGISSASFYGLLERLGIPTDPRKSPRERKLAAEMEYKPSETGLFKAVPFNEAITPKAEIKQNNGLSLQYKGTYTGKQIEKVLERLQLILADEGTTYRVDIAITEDEKTQ